VGENFTRMRRGFFLSGVLRTKSSTIGDVRTQMGQTRSCSWAVESDLGLVIHGDGRPASAQAVCFDFWKGECKISPQKMSSGAVPPVLIMMGGYNPEPRLSGHAGGFALATRAGPIPEPGAPSAQRQGRRQP